MNVLDNPFWHALVGPQAHLARGTGPARRYAPGLATQGGLAAPSEAAFRALADTVEAGSSVDLFFAAAEPVRPGWRLEFEVELQQMVVESSLAPGTPVAFVELGDDDAADMLALAEATHPGPFLAGAVRLGRFVGVRSEGRLVAMAGERANPPGHREISGVCTLPSFRGRGLASALVRELATGRALHGEEVFLHVELGNRAAIRLYERMGFVARRRFVVAVLQRTGGT